MLYIDQFLKSLEASKEKGFIFQLDSRLIRIYTDSFSNYDGMFIVTMKNQYNTFT